MSTMGRLVPNFGKGGSIGESEFPFVLFWSVFWPVLCKGTVHLFLLDKTNNPLKKFQIWQKHWAGPPTVGLTSIYYQTLETKNYL